MNCNSWSEITNMQNRNQQFQRPMKYPKPVSSNMSNNYFSTTQFEERNNFMNEHVNSQNYNEIITPWNSGYSNLNFNNVNSINVINCASTNAVPSFSNLCEVSDPINNRDFFPEHFPKNVSATQKQERSFESINNYMSHQSQNFSENVNYSTNMFPYHCKANNNSEQYCNYSQGIYGNEEKYLMNSSTTNNCEFNSTFMYPNIRKWEPYLAHENSFFYNICQNVNGYAAQNTSNFFPNNYVPNNLINMENEIYKNCSLGYSQFKDTDSQSKGCIKQSFSCEKLVLENHDLEKVYNESNFKEDTFQYQNKRSRSKSNSRDIHLKRQCRSRSRSKSRNRYFKRYRSRSRSRSRSKSRFRSRSSSRPRFRSKFRSRSRSKSRSRYPKNSRNRRSSSFDSTREKLGDRKELCFEKNKQFENERQKLIEKWRMNYCDTHDEMQKRLQIISLMDPEEILEEENKVWIRSAQVDLYYQRDESNPKRILETERLNQLCKKFKYEILERGKRIRQTQTLKCPAPAKPKQKLCKHISQDCSSSDESGSENSDESDDVNDIIEELQRKQKHPYRLHPELWYNDPGEMNDGPLCRCSAKARRSGIRHGFYAGENERSYCDPKSNNAGKLYHYRITISPPTNFLTRTPTIINYDDHEFIFEGFSLLSHYQIKKLPVCKVIRFNIEYMILYVEEKLPENFTIQELDLFYEYLFKEILELVDFDLKSSEFPDSCPQFHFMPRFVRELPEKGRELLPMSEVLKYLLQSNKKLIDDDDLNKVHKMSNSDWQNFADLVKGMVVTNPGMKPCSLRVDQLDRDTYENSKKLKRTSPDLSAVIKKSPFCERHLEKDSKENIKFDKAKQHETKDNFSFDSDVITKNETQTSTQNETRLIDKFYPEIVHFGIRPPQLSYAGNPEYQKAWRKYVKYRHLLANMPKPTAEDKQKLAAKENCLHTMRANSKMKRDVTVTVSSKGFYLTGLMCDVVQHAMLIPVLVCHLRFHRSLTVLENKINYDFKNRFLLQLALTHPSYRENFGTNSDHARNSLTNCGIRQPKYGDRRIHYMNTKKRGINTLINIMSRFGKKNETQSNIYHNERLEFLGDAVVEFVTSIHLFHIFRDIEEGGLATYRAALVQNQHLAVLAKKLNLDKFMLYAHGSDLCHDLELKHAMANCFEALMGALFLDGGIDAVDKVFGMTLYGDEEDCLDIWLNYPPHPLQEQEPLGDRKWISQFPFLQKLTEFEEATGIEFKHIRLLARAFTDRSVGYTNLTLGSNQRLEFLGDSVLQLIASEYLYKYFPEHHEGHLSLLRSSLVNNKTQSVVCDDLGMTKYAVYANPKVELKIKDRADLLEAFLGALYVDSGLDICRVFCDVCFFPRLQLFIMNQDWNDPKSKLQQCCLTLRTMDNAEPDIPIYKVVECKGPTNTRVYTVAVYFRNKRLAKATGHSIQQAEMNAALKAMELSGPLFPQLDHQKRVIANSLKTQKWPNRKSWSSEPAKNSNNKVEHDSKTS